ncbi:LysR family transcriptional regulator [Pseudorhodoplanes sinuspersici]|uniref:LysR family transcriptional regulator n=1 Tax=Pseudorhodoplanes sinuspersici TaxID=1235591 RepID=A0A1W6ZP37_9HYPH|nr:LysR family transcriptional regulator [Pseudorhodoplanes sinuspersici]ARP99007.1 LysR family transcriptional regulator [Pseudorhodoplanes sinuspersici]
MKHLRFLHYFEAVARAGSIRKAAEQLHVTSSAVNRRIMDLEEELETPLFERRPRGVRLTAAGELFVHYVREQTADLDRVRSQIEDLKGMRRGTVRIAASQALALEFLPREVSAYRASFPYVHFDVRVQDHIRAMESLASYEVDLVLVFRPPYLPNFRPLMMFEQRLMAVMPAAHPLAAKKTIRLRDCAPYPVALAEQGIGGRQLLDEALGRGNFRFDIVAQSNSFEFLRHLVMRNNVISFQIQIGTISDEGRGIVTREIDERDAPRGDLVLGQLRGRNLPVASAKFAEQLSQSLLTMRTEPSSKRQT